MFLASSSPRVGPASGPNYPEAGVIVHSEVSVFIIEAVDGQRVSEF